MALYFERAWAVFGERFSAGGWVSWLLALGLAILAYRLYLSRRRLLLVRRELHGARVRQGYLAESLAPLVHGFPVDVTKEGTTTLFLGQPVDYVHFDPEEGVHFVEVKSGRAGLSERQRALRQRIEDGQVRWSTFRVDLGGPRTDLD